VAIRTKVPIADGLNTAILMSPANPGTHPDTGPVARGITMMWYRDNMSGVE